MIVVAISGGFDPIHPGHIRHIKAAMKLGNKLVVILTRSDQLILKKGDTFHPTYEERKEIIEYGLRDGDMVLPNTDDKDSIMCIKSLRMYKPDIFAKGGDSWNADNLPEALVCKELGIKIVFGVGGEDKVQSSSSLTGLISKVVHNPTTGNDYPVRRRHVQE